MNKKLSLCITRVREALYDVNSVVFKNSILSYLKTENNRVKKRVENWLLAYFSFSNKFQK